MFLVTTFCAMLLIITFIYAGIKKLTIFKEFTASLELTFKVPSKLSKIVALIIVLAELTILPILLAAEHLPFIYIILNLVMFLFVCIPAYALFSGKTIQCSCFGEQNTLGWQDLLRNIILLVSSLVLSIWHTELKFELYTASLTFLAIATIAILINIKPIHSFIFKE